MKKALSVCCCLLLFLSVFALPAGAAKHDVRDLLNAAPLSPLPTGRDSLDRQIAGILGRITTDKMSVCEKTEAVFEYCVKNFTYQQSEIFLSHDMTSRYLVMEDVVSIAQAETMLRTRKGVCNDFAALLMVFTRAIGLESYKVGGQVRAAGGGMTGHQWTVIRLKGRDYLFDAQLENQYYVRNGVMTWDFFGIPAEEADWYDLSYMKEYIDGFGRFEQIKIDLKLSHVTPEGSLLPDEPLRIGIADVSASVPVTGCRFLYLEGNYEELPISERYFVRPGPELFLSPPGPGEWTVFIEADTETGRVIARVLHYRWLKMDEVVFLPGDVDADGTVTSADARLALRASVGLEHYYQGSIRYFFADADRDGWLTPGDARLILRASVKLENLSETASQERT